jgi:predicted peptidase
MPGAQQAQTFAWQGPRPNTVHFWLYLPEEYGSDPSKRWPLVLFLHGRGESGNNLELVTREGLPKLIKAGQQFPFIVVSPQCPVDERWATYAHTGMLNALLDKIEREYAVDADRIYVTGLSMGGFGTWALATSTPHRFAAIAPICGGGDSSKVAAIKHLPIWVFHGAQDSVVSLACSEEMFEALKACNGNVRLTVYPEAGHDSWTQTYDNPELYTWLLAQRRTAEDTQERE